AAPGQADALHAGVPVSAADQLPVSDRRRFSATAASAESDAERRRALGRADRRPPLRMRSSRRRKRPRIGRASAEAPPDAPVSLAAYRHWGRWPLQRLGVRAYLRSTYDRTGHNRTADASHYLYQEAEDFNVTLDV